MLVFLLRLVGNTQGINKDENNNTILPDEQEEKNKCDETDQHDGWIDVNHSIDPFIDVMYATLDP